MVIGLGTIRICHMETTKVLKFPKNLAMLCVFSNFARFL